MIRPAVWVIFSGIVFVHIARASDQDRIEAKLNKRHQLIHKLFSQIQTDLQPWQKKGITLQEVERTYCTAFTGGFVDGGFRVQILDGELYIVGELAGYADFNRGVKLLLLDVARHHKLPDADFVLSTSDTCRSAGQFNGSKSKCPDMAPLFTYSKTKDNSHCVLYPDHTFGGWPTVHLPAWQDLWDLMEGKQQHSWESRADKLFFRGAKTGNRNWLADNKTFLQLPEIDIDFSEWTGDPSASFVTLPEHCNYRYLLHLPGQAYSSRLKNLLLCKSTVVFPKDGSDEFWYHLLENGTNVVLAEALSWKRGGEGVSVALAAIKQNPKLAESVAANGHELVRRALRPDNVRRYFAELIRAYASLQKFHISRHPDAIPLEISTLGPDRNITQAGRTCTICR